MRRRGDPEGASHPGGAFLFGDFLLGAQEKVTRLQAEPVLKRILYCQIGSKPNAAGFEADEKKLTGEGYDVVFYDIIILAVTEFFRWILLLFLFRPQLVFQLFKQVRIDLVEVLDGRQRRQVR